MSLKTTSLLTIYPALDNKAFAPLPRGYYQQQIKFEQESVKENNSSYG